MPVLNVAVNNLSKNVLKICLIVLAVISCTILRKSDVLALNGGYTVIWLLFLYLLGAYIFKYKPLKNIKAYKLIIVVVICIVFSWAWKIIFEGLDFENVIISYLHNRSGGFISYVSPTILLVAISLLELFSRLKFKNKPKIIAFFAPISFGVYLIHEQKYIRDNLIIGRFVTYASYNPIIMVLAVLGTAMGIYVVCSLIDYLRLLLFKALKIKPTLQKIENKFSNKLLKGERDV